MRLLHNYMRKGMWSKAFSPVWGWRVYQKTRSRMLWPGGGLEAVLEPWCEPFQG